jgi:hypothetical protein
LNPLFFRQLGAFASSRNRKGVAGAMIEARSSMLETLSLDRRQSLFMLP